MGKRIAGFSNPHIALLVADSAEAITYAKPEKLARGVKATVDPKTSSDKTYSDDVVEDIFNDFESIDVGLDINTLSNADRAKIQGSTIVKGMILDSKNDEAPFLALGFKALKTNGKYRYVWLLKGKFALASDDYETQKEKRDPKTQSLKSEFVPREKDGYWRFMVDEDDEGVDAETITNWFTEVPTVPIIPEP